LRSFIAIHGLWSNSAFGPFLLATGAAAYALTALVRTKSALRRWGSERLSTDTDLLDILEDCKSEAGLNAPIGLVVSAAVSAPMILGWVRPRILLPAPLAASLSRDQLRAVLFHELAHFRAHDVPLNWLFTAVCSLHWFNPLAHLSFRVWTRSREEAADEAALNWLRQPSGLAYGETLLHVLRSTAAAATAPAPFSALAIVESVHQLKKRLLMIKHYENKSPRSLLIGALLTVIALGMFLRPIQAGDAPADANSVANGPALKWLQEIDAGQYAQSWTDAAPMFQKAVTSEGWVATSKNVRAPLGKCLSRKLASASSQTIAPGSAAAPAGDYIMAQFETSFAGLKYAVETVSFVKAPDGAWKAAGYYIKPNL
jgi:hypothetical protein